MMEEERVLRLECIKLAISILDRSVEGKVGKIGGLPSYELEDVMKTATVVLNFIKNS